MVEGIASAFMFEGVAAAAEVDETDEQEN